MIRRKSVRNLAPAVLVLMLASCQSGSDNGNQTSTPASDEFGVLKTDAIDLTATPQAQASLINHYRLNPLNINLQAAQYALPLSASDIANYSEFSGTIALNSEAQRRLLVNGFVVIDYPYVTAMDDIVAPYKALKEQVPIFITTDSLLHLYHIQFDETLRNIEEQQLAPAAWTMAKRLFDSSVQTYQTSTGLAQEAARRNVAYFAIALRLLQPDTALDIPSAVRGNVDAEINAIMQHQGFALSPLFHYQEDYSQYLPRGHYTRSEALKNYFRAFMWFGRLTFLLKPDLITSPNPALDAKIETLQALLIADRFRHEPDVKQRWDLIYKVTAFFVGLSDDLGPYEYMHALDQVFGSEFDAGLFDDAAWDGIKTYLVTLPSPRINGGTGNCVVTEPFTPAKRDACLDAAKGMRIMGQRYVPDSYMFSNLVNYDYIGSKTPFTLMAGQDIPPIRGFPRGLDVMSVLGSKRADALLHDLGDTEYKDYEKALQSLKNEFGALTAADWNRNLYWSWLYNLQPMLTEFGPGYPTFMRTTAWQDRSLTTALASWSQLRHDTILYAKQSYTLATTTSVGPAPKPVVGYVEPVPELYNRLLALTRMTNEGLSNMGMLDAAAQARLNYLQNILARLLDISTKELKNVSLNQDDYDFIKDFGDALDGAVGDVDPKAKKTTIIADVHTDPNSRQVLEEGTGHVRLMVVAYKLPDDRILLGAGPALSYYEFKQPMAQRLTDEAWRDLLTSAPPATPEWTQRYTAPP